MQRKPTFNTDKGGKRLIRLDGSEFISRFLLQMPLPNPQAMESAKDFMARVARIDAGLCPRCKTGRLQVGAVVQGSARLPAPTGVVAQQSRGPP